MPMIARRLGATIIYPPDPDVTALFGGLGKVIEVESSSEFDALSVVTATYATYFKYLDTIHRWLKAHVALNAGLDVRPRVERDEARLMPASRWLRSIPVVKKRG